jgi:hypothetical protein
VRVEEESELVRALTQLLFEFRTAEGGIGHINSPSGD